MKIKDLGRAIRAFDHPFGLCQHLKNVSLFYLLQRMSFPIRRLSARCDHGLAVGHASADSGSKSRPNFRIDPRESTTARSITFCNSRMFPGQS